MQFLLKETLENSQLLFFVEKRIVKKSVFPMKNMTLEFFSIFVFLY